MNAYRPEIDGLRAVAVLSVLLFHLGVPQFSGGYVGVDVFFVISGYLITRLIRSDVEAGSFTFGRFYIRRARRLFPALFFTLVLTTIGACLLFSPAHLANFSASLIAAILSVSNFQFWNESGYFNLDSSIKPLLHTWSLGVEEQFYFIWPLTLWLLLRFRSRAVVLIVIAAAGIISFALNFGALRWFAEGPATIFYLLPFRIFEFAIGAAMVWARPTRRPAALESLAALGLALIAWPVLSYTDKTLFPSYNALAPCIGTALVIYAGSARYVGALLRNRVAVGIGLISYSLYLVHWPLIVFWRYVTLQPLGPGEQVALAAGAFAAAFLMHRYVETPFRTRRAIPQSRFVIGAIAGSAAVLLAGVLIFRDAGWPQRIPDARFALSSREYEDQETAACGPKVDETALVTCSAERESNKSIYVWGDSHARHLIEGLTDRFPDFNIRILYFTGCRAESGLFGYLYTFEGRAFYADACAKRNRDALAYFSKALPTTILLHHFMSDGEVSANQITDATARLIDALTSYGHNVKFIGDVIRPSIYLPDCYTVPAAITDRMQNRRCRGDEAVSENLARQNDQFAKMFGSHFINPNDAFRDSGTFLTAVDGHLLFRDTNHLTPFGSRYLVGRIADDIGAH